MSPSETIEADLLARWIDGERDTVPGEECMVAVWAMRPDLAPSPRVSLDDVLARVTTGPLFENISASDSDVPDVTDEIEMMDTIKDEMGDDFVQAIFAQSRSREELSVSLDDVLSRVNTGPLSRNVSVSSADTSAANELEPQSANNDRWWSAPWVAGGLAVALVLFTLLPSQFEAPVSEDSIFAPKFEAEEALPAEDVEARIQPDPSKKSASQQEKALERLRQPIQEEQKPLTDTLRKSETVLPKKALNVSKPQAPKAKRAEEVQVGSIGEMAIDALEEKGIAIQANQETPVGNKSFKEQKDQEEQETEKIDPTNSSVDIVSESDYMYNDLNGTVGNTGTNEFIGNTGNTAVIEGLGRVDFSAQGAVSQLSADEDADLMDLETQDDAYSEPEAAEPPIPLEDTVVEEIVLEEVEEEFESVAVTRTTLDAVTTESIVKESAKLPRRKKERSGAGLFAKQQAPSAAEAPMDETFTSEIEQAADQLPAVLTLQERQTIKRAQNVESVLSLCSVNRPTESLEMLWLASRFASSADAIVLLGASSQYDNGDSRYLKRNWLLLATLLRQTGRTTEAVEYEQRALSLP